MPWNGRSPEGGSPRRSVRHRGSTGRRVGIDRLGRGRGAGKNLPHGDGSSTVPITLSRPPQRGHANTSIANASRGSRGCDDLAKPRLSSGGCETRPAWVSPLGSVASLAPSAATSPAMRRPASVRAVGMQPRKGHSGYRGRRSARWGRLTLAWWTSRRIAASEGRTQCAFRNYTPSPRDPPTHPARTSPRTCLG